MWFETLMGFSEEGPDQVRSLCSVEDGVLTSRINSKKYRNYFVPVGEQIGQSADQQIDCLDEVGLELGNTADRLWKMHNGYALASEAGLIEINARLATATESDLDRIREKLKIGVHWRTQVTLNECDHDVAQVYGSALPVAYSPLPAGLWAPLARLILEASYEATLLAGLINARAGGNNRIYLTLLGGGAFGNEESWILDAIRRALGLVENQALDLRIVSYGE